MPSQIVNPPGGGGSGDATDINGIPVASGTPDELQALVVINGQYAPRNIPGLTPLPDVDVAFGRPATASSTYTNVGGVAPGNAFDSNLNNSWAAAEHATAPHWLQVDLGASHIISSWHYAGYNDGSGSNAIMRDFQLQYLDESDNTTWQIADIISGNSELNSFTHTIAESASRYWRVYITQGTQIGADGIPRISQVKLFEKYVEPVPQRQATENQMGSVFLRDDLGGSASHPRVAAIQTIPIDTTAPDGTNNTFTYDLDSATIKWLPGVNSLTPEDTSGSDMALGKSVTYSSVYNQSGFYNPGDYAVDGNDSSQWATTPSASYPHILTVDLGSVKTINKWRVKGYSDGSGPDAVLNNYQCQYLDVDDGATWHTADSVSGNSARETTATFSPAASRYWRLYITACTTGGDNIARVSTFSLFERIPAGGLLKINGVNTDGTLPTATHNIFTFDPGTNSIKWLPLAFLGASVSASSPISVPVTTQTFLSFDTPDYDTGGFYDAAHPTRLTIPTGKRGYYRLTAGVRFQPGGGARREIFLRANGSTVLVENEAQASNTTYNALSVTRTVLLEAGDYVEVGTYIEDNLSTYNTPPPFFQLERLG